VYAFDWCRNILSFGQGLQYFYDPGAAGDAEAPDEASSPCSAWFVARMAPARRAQTEKEIAVCLEAATRVPKWHKLWAMNPSKAPAALRTPADPAMRFGTL
jgi:hypothetical protein